MKYLTKKPTLKKTKQKQQETQQLMHKGKRSTYQSL